MKLLAIDPDASKSGVALLDTDKRIFDFVGSLSFVETFEFMQYADKIVIEAGWLNEGNWHIKPNTKASIACKIGNSTGRNHETGRKLVEVCKDYFKKEPEQIRPLKKCWKGEDGKITNSELSYFTHYNKRTNQDQRDAMLIAWVCAGLPVIVRTLKRK